MDLWTRQAHSSCAHDFCDQTEPFRFQRPKNRFWEPIYSPALGRPGLPMRRQRGSHSGLWPGAGSRNTPPRCLAAPEALRVAFAAQCRRFMEQWVCASLHFIVTAGHRPAPPGRDSAMDCCPERTPTQRVTKPRGKCAGPGCRRYFGGSWTESSILASPRFSSKSPVFLLVPVRLVPSVSEFAPALARPLLLLAAGSCSTLRRCVCRPPWPELAFASAFVADFAPFPDLELHLPS